MPKSKPKAPKADQRQRFIEAAREMGIPDDEAAQERAFGNDGDGGSLCARLTQRGVPFLIYSGAQTTDEAPFLSKPATHAMLRDAVEAVIRDHKTSH